MKKKHNNFCHLKRNMNFHKLLFPLIFLFSTSVIAQIVTYPDPPLLKKSLTFTLTVNDIAVSVQELGPNPFKDSVITVNSTKDQVYRIWWDNQKRKDKMIDSLNISNFSCKGKLTYVITANENINSFIIRPKSKGIIGKVFENKLTFTVSGPSKIMVEINKLNPLAIFADPLEINPPKQGDVNVVFFGPGISNPGTIKLQSNQTIYIAGGAVVNGNITGTDVQNVKIMGRGILQGYVRVDGASNLRFDGIIVHNQFSSWTNTLTNCHHSEYNNVKVISYSIPWGTDGINPVGCTFFTINDCFIRTGDDCIAIKCNYGQHVDSISITNNILAGYNSNDGVTLGFELDGSPIENVLVKNCDVLYARGNNSVQGHSGFSIISDGPGYVSNIRFEDIRVEENVEFKNFELKVTTGHLYVIDRPGHIKGVYLKNIVWEKADAPIVLSGHGPGNMVEDVTFDNCTVHGKLLKSIADAHFEINPYVRNIKFVNTGK
jgi:Glycosyl hydrolases family 28